MNVRCPVCFHGRWLQTPRNTGKGGHSRSSFCAEHLAEIHAADRAAYASSRRTSAAAEPQSREPASLAEEGRND